MSHFYHRMLTIEKKSETKQSRKVTSSMRREWSNRCEPVQLTFNGTYKFDPRAVNTFASVDVVDENEGQQIQKRTRAIFSIPLKWNRIWIWCWKDRQEEKSVATPSSQVEWQFRQKAFRWDLNCFLLRFLIRFDGKKNRRSTECRVPRQQATSYLPVKRFFISIKKKKCRKGKHNVNGRPSVPFRLLPRLLNLLCRFLLSCVSAYSLSDFVLCHNKIDWRIGLISSSS